MSTHFSFQAKAKVFFSFFCAALAMVALLGTTWKLADDSEDASRLVGHTFEVLHSLAEVKANTLQIEFSTQNYRITGDQAHLAERDATIALRETTLARIRQLTADSAAQQERWARLREVLDERIAVSRRVETLRDTEGLAAASAYAAGAPLRETRQRIYRIMAEMEDTELKLLAVRNAEQRKARRHAVGAGIAVTLSLIALLAVSYLLIRRQLRRTDEQNALLEQRVQQRTAQLRESQEHLRSVVTHVPALIAFVDARQRYVYANEQYRNRYAAQQEGLAGRTVQEVLGAARYAIAAPMIERVLSGTPQSYDWQPFPDVWQSISYVPKRDALGQICGYYVLGTDITQRKKAEDEIQALNATLARQLGELQRVDRALRTLSAGNRSMLRAADEQDLLDSMCAAIAHAGGYPIAMVWYAQQDARKSLHAVAQSGYPAGLAALQQLQPSWADNAYGQGAVATAVRTGQAVVVGDMQTDPHYAPWRPYLLGNTSCFACPLVVAGSVIGALALFSPAPDDFGPDEVPLLCESAQDLAFGIATLRASTEKARAQAAIHQLTHYDALTGLPNETGFTESLSDCMRAATARGRSLAVLQANIERLSEINDALGFAHGDEVLKVIASRLRSAAPAQATVARLRGDEFAVLLPDAGAEHGTALAARLAAAMRSPVPVADIQLEVSVKTGIAVFPDHAAGTQELLRRLAIAVHDAQTRGVHHAVFDPAQDREKPQRLGLAGELRRAIEGGELQVFLQPKVAFATGSVCGAEALVRWRHAGRGMVPPGEFIGLAEHTGLIKPLTEWMLESVARLGQAWKGRDCALPIAVNLSARNLHDEDLIRKIRSWGPALGLLELEITESAVMQNADRALAVLRSLRDEGIPLYIDDFGTGYSSLSYLQKLPVEHIKIDQSFVRGMATDRDSAVIVRSTIDLAHDLGRKTVAEGIETREAWAQLAALGCDVAQGYFIARPMPAAEFPQWLERQRAGVLSPAPARALACA